MTESIKSRQEHEKLIEASRKIKQASKISRFVLGSIERGHTDVPARTRRFPLIFTGVHMSDEVYAVVSDNLSTVGIETDSYSNYLGCGDSEDRIVVTEVFGEKQ